MIVANETIVKAKRGRASAGRAATSLDRLPLYNLSLLASKVAGRIAVEYQRAVGLQLPEARVMTVLGSLSPVSSNAVVHHTSMDKATVSRAIVRLIRSGLVSRTPDPRDRRLLVLSLTTKGKRAHRKLAEAARVWQSWFFAEFPEAEQARLNQMLLLLLERVRGGNGAHAAPRGTEPLTRRRAGR